MPYHPCEIVLEEAMIHVVASKISEVLLGSSVNQPELRDRTPTSLCINQHIHQDIVAIITQ